MQKTYRVDGMMCGGCAKSVIGAVEKISGVKSAVVDDKFTCVTVDFADNADDAAVKEAVESAGFDFVG
ncbi:MAG: heavy metal-associated domain-containing protein [Acutalibacteraceae bacterium]